MKIYINKSYENWIVDRFRKEWYNYNSNLSVENFLLSDIFWVMSPWAFKNYKFKFIKNKKVVYTIHHIEDEEKTEFFNKIKKIDKYIDCYHVISKKTIHELSIFTDKKIFYTPFWIDSKKWFYIENKEKLKKKFGLNNSTYYVGSFQRDSLGKNPNLPKLIKGPDIFLKNVLDLKKNNPNLEVILTGRRRDFIINELNKENIPFKYFEMVNQQELNELYNCLDLYIVSSRIEGGPQAIPECALTRTPIVSTDVGMASEFMNQISIYEPNTFLEAKSDLNYLIKSSQKLKIPQGFDEFYKMFNSI